MAMSLTRTGTVAVVGVGAGGLDQAVKPLVLGGTPTTPGTTIHWGTILAAISLVGGAVMQFASPHTMPNLVDGLVDGGAAILVYKGTIYALKKANVTAGPAVLAGGGYAPYAFPSYDGGHAALSAGKAGRGQVGSVSNLPKRVLS